MKLITPENAQELYQPAGSANFYLQLKKACPTLIWYWANYSAAPWQLTADISFPSGVTHYAQLFPHKKKLFITGFCRTVIGYEKVRQKLCEVVDHSQQEWKNYDTHTTQQMEELADLESQYDSMINGRL